MGFGLIFWLSGLIFGFLNLYFKFLELYLGFRTCICVSELIFWVSELILWVSGSGRVGPGRPGRAAGSGEFSIWGKTHFWESASEK